MQAILKHSKNNKRIAKNVVMLYARMLIIMGVSLYTSRIVLNALGVDDYGIYNVVAGFVMMFTMISGSIGSAISRFITFELGKSNQKKLNAIFSTAIILQIVTGVFIFILVETGGVWFLTNKMVIPPDRMLAAQWVLQFSLFSLLINLICVPYNAVIIAHERMSAFTYISIIDVVGKLVIAYLITISAQDKLIIYALLMSSVALLIRLAYVIYCKRNFEECKKIHFMFDKRLLKEMFGFAGWNFISIASTLMRNQGNNIVLNLFGGPAINAARGISVQVNNAVTSFSTNFMVALNPQITKSYANGDRDYMMNLIFKGARLSFYVLLLISLPVLLNTNYLLSIWLGIVPANTVLFIQLALILGMIEAISNPLITAMLATGKIRKYQIVVGGFQLMNLPISYMLLKKGLFPEIILVVAILISLLCLLITLYMLKQMLGMPIIKFSKKVLLNVLLVSFISIVIPCILKFYLEVNFINVFLICLVTLLSTISTIYLVGCNRSEQEFVKNQITQFIHKKNI